MELGSYFGNDPGSVQRYENWLGRRIDNVLFYLNQSSWTAFDSSVSWAVNLWKPVDRHIIWSVPLTVDGTSLAAVAQGWDNSHFADAARQLSGSRTDAGPIYVRLGWELNGSWMPWAAEGHEADFKKAYQTVVDQFRGVSDRFKFVWDVNVGGSYDSSRAYPGDAYVDVVGSDFYYDKTWDSANPATAFDTKVNQEHGLQWISDFATAHGKGFAVSEWGVESDDAGAYIDAAAAWFQSHNAVYANYWESDAAGYSGSLTDGSKPHAADAYKKSFATHQPDQPDRPSGQADLVLRVSQDAFQGDAKFTVAVDGKAIQGVFSAHASHVNGQTDTIRVAGDFSHARNVAVTFVNDLYFGNAAADRNLYVESVSVGNNTIAGDQASNLAGTSVGGAAGLYANGSAVFALADGQQNTLAITVSEDAYQGDAKFRVFVDGKQAGGVQTAHASHSLGQSETINVHGAFSATPSDVRIEFLNDLYGGSTSTDRNLYVSHVAINGHGVDGSQGVNGAGWNQSQTAGLYSNGSLVFHGANSSWL